MRRDKRAAAIFLPFLLGGFAVWGGACQGYVFEPVLSGFLISDTVEIEIPQISRLDILFVVDDSGSMRGNQDNLARNLDTFIVLLEELNAKRQSDGLEPVDFQIAVASTSIYQRIQLDGTLLARTTYNIGAGSACLEGTAYQMQNNDPYPDGKFMAAGSNDAVITSEHFLSNPTDALRQFRENVRLGICGSAQEQGLEAMRRALIANPTFFRPQSRLMVIFLTDEEDASDRTEQFIAYYAPPLPGTKNRDGLTDARLEFSLNDELTPVSFYKQFLDGLARERKGSVAIAAIVSAIGTPPWSMEAETGDAAEEFNCLDDVCAAACASPNPSGSPCYCGGVSPGSRYLELAGMYSENDHLMDSICQTDFSQTLERLIEIATVDQCFELTSPPHDDNLSLVMVRIERAGGYILCTPPDEPGQQACDTGADWYFDTEQNKLCLCSESQCRLEPGDSYRLSIIAQACSAESPCSP